MYIPLYGAGLCLNPEFHHVGVHDYAEGKAYRDLVDMAFTVHDDATLAAKALNQYSTYANKVCQQARLGDGKWSVFLEMVAAVEGLVS